MSFRAFHAAIAVEQLLAIAYVWWCALSGRRDRLLRIAVATLIAEGVFVTANRGDCPLGPLQDRLGDPVPLFELVLSPRAAKRAVPTLGAITAAGLVLLVVRGPRDARLFTGFTVPEGRGRRVRVSDYSEGRGRRVAARPHPQRCRASVDRVRGAALAAINHPRA
jgi:hypothetical protein